MSFSNPKLSNPATKFIEFKGDVGMFRYFDKEKGENGENVELSMPLYFVVLDELSTITGFNEKVKAGMYSNEVRNIKDDILNVRSFKGGIQIVGKYAEIKETIKANAGKYCKSVYAMLITGKNTYELVHFKMTGASFGGVKDGRSGWFNKKVNTDKFGIVVKECDPGQVGPVKFQAPVFSALKLTPELINAATEMDKELQKYLSNYFSQVVEKEVTQNETAQTEIVEAETVEQEDLLFSPAAKSKYETKTYDVSDVNDLPF
jgi:hypothetical protein